MLSVIPWFLLLKNFRDLVLEDKGSGLAAQLVAALVADQLEAGAGGAAGGVAELAAALQAGAPAYFRDQDRQFFQVRQIGGLFAI